MRYTLSDVLIVAVTTFITGVGLTMEWIGVFEGQQ